MAPENHWRIPEALEKVILIPQSLHLHLKWWFLEENVLQGQPLHPLSDALQIFMPIHTTSGTPVFLGSRPAPRSLHSSELFTLQVDGH